MVVAVFCSFLFPSKKVAILVKGNNDFTFKLYSQLKGEQGNLFFSPYSISAALAMIYAGAASNTEKQMSEMLNFSSIQKQFHPTFKKFQNKIVV